MKKIILGIMAAILSAGCTTDTTHKQIENIDIPAVVEENLKNEEAQTNIQSDNIKTYEDKDGTKCSVDIYQDQNYQYHITVKNKSGENLLILSTYTSDIRNIIRFLDVNMDGYADIQFLEGEGVLNSSYYLYVWDDSVEKFVKVKYDDMISDFKVYDGYLINRGKNDANSGVIEKLVWKGNSLIKESEEPYQADE